MARTSGTVPTALLAAVTATQRVRSDSTAVTALSGSSSVSGSGSANRTVAPARSAAISHGPTFASWSRRVQTISSPGSSARPAAAANFSVSDVMLGPKTTPCGSAPSSAPTVARVESTSSSVARPASKSPPWFALLPDRIQSAIASIAVSTICVPAGPSSRAQPSRSPGKRSRFTRRETIPVFMAEEPDGAPKKSKAALERAVRTDTNPQLLKIARWMRQRLPGDAELGDALSTHGDEPSLVLARRLSELGTERPSATRELGLGALQVWQALSEAQGRGRGQREVAILFTDLVEFSAWALEAGDDAALDLLRRVGACEDAAVTSHGGRVVKRLGDGMMAAFNDPEAAVRAACEARAKVATIEVPSYEPVLRAGIHLGRPRKVGGDYLGIDVNVAPRVTDGAKAGEILVTGPVCDRISQTAFELKRRRRFKAKGAPKELEVFSVEPV